MTADLKCGAWEFGGPCGDRVTHVLGVIRSCGCKTDSDRNYPVCSRHTTTATGDFCNRCGRRGVITLTEPVAIERTAS